jgi:hypothetical protein
VGEFKAALARSLAAQRFEEAMEESG